jgi:pimeloyl-ACP methyl ester carboxylesterase
MQTSSALRQRIHGLMLAMLFGAALAGPAYAAPGLRYQTIEGEGGVPLNVVSAGDPARPALLLVHGIGQSHVSFEEQLRGPLAEQFHVVSFDLRGHGNSGKPWSGADYQDSAKWAGDVHRVIETLGLRRPVLLGWSYGTLVVSDYLRHYGTQNLAGIVLTGAYGGLTPPPPPAPPAIAEQMTRNRALQWSADPVENALAARTMAAQLTARDMGDAWHSRAAQIAMMLPAYARRHMFDRSLANMDLIAKIDVPVMLNVGAKDLSTPEAPARELAAKLERQGVRAVVSVYPDAGHSPFAEEPNRFNAELTAFVRAAQPSAAGAAGPM